MDYLVLFLATPTLEFAFAAAGFNFIIILLKINQFAGPFGASIFGAFAGIVAIQTLYYINSNTNIIRAVFALENVNIPDFRHDHLPFAGDQGLSFTMFAVEVATSI